MNTILDHLRSSRYHGCIENADGVGLETGNPWLVTIKFWIKVEDGVITDVKFKTQGCATSIACSSMLAEMALEKSVADARALSYQEVASALGKVPPEKTYCCRLSMMAFQRAIDDYRSDSS